MSSQPTTSLSPAEYLELERKAERKSEYFAGEMFLMAGASLRHGVIVLNVGAELRQHLKARPCIIYSSDVRLRVSPSGLYTYPDVMVVCGEPQFAGDQKDTVLNPNLIVVTAAYHMPRSLRVFSSLMPHVKLIPYPVEVEGFSSFWTRPRKLEMLHFEYLKYLASFVMTLFDHGGNKGKVHHSN